MTPNQILSGLAGSPTERQAAADAAMHQGEELGAIAAHLARHAGDPDIGESCLAALEKCGPPARDDLELLITLLTGHELPAYWAATLLGRLGAEAAPAAAALAHTAAADAPLAVRERAVWALGQIGPEAAGATSTLEAVAQEPHARLARLAKQAIASIRG